MKRKTPKLKSKTPPAVSGKDFHQNLLKIQSEKEKLQFEKEQRKEEREKKKAEKNKCKSANGERGKKRKINRSDDSSNADIVIMETDSDDLDDIEDENMCYACLGNEGLDEGSNWIGCNRCSRWFHRTCLSEEIEKMTREELVAFNFVCAPCT